MSKGTMAKRRRALKSKHFWVEPGLNFIGHCAKCDKSDKIKQVCCSLGKIEKSETLKVSKSGTFKYGRDRGHIRCPKCANHFDVQEVLFSRCSYTMEYRISGQKNSEKHSNEASGDNDHQYPSIKCWHVFSYSKLNYDFCDITIEKLNDEGFCGRPKKTRITTSKQIGEKQSIGYRK
eukprot:UN31226